MYYLQDEKGPQTPNIRLYRKEEPDMNHDINSNSSCFSNEINQCKTFIIQIYSQIYFFISQPFLYDNKHCVG